jgi:Flp pilus assembly pilin Flp
MYKFRLKGRLKGASTVEYGLITLLVGSAAVGVASSLGVSIFNIYDGGYSSLRDSTNLVASVETSPTPFDGSCEVLSAGNDTSSGTNGIFCYDLLSGLDNFDMSSSTEDIGVRMAVDDDAGLDVIRLGSGDNFVEGGMRMKYYGGSGVDNLDLTETAGSMLLNGSSDAVYNVGAGDDVLNIDISSPSPPAYFQLNTGLGNDTVNARCDFTEPMQGNMILTQEGLVGNFENCVPRVITSNWDGAISHNVTLNHANTERWTGSGNFSYFEIKSPGHVEAKISGGMDSKWNVTMKNASTANLDIDMVDSEALSINLQNIDAASSLISMEVDADLNHMLLLSTGTKVSSDWNLNIPRGGFVWNISKPMPGAQLELSDWGGMPNIDLFGNTPDSARISVGISTPNGVMSVYNAGVFVRSFPIDCGSICTNFQRYGPGFGTLDFDEIRISDGVDNGAILFNAANPKLYIDTIYLAVEP